MCQISTDPKKKLKIQLLKTSQGIKIEHFVKFEFDQVRQSWFSTMKIFLGAEN